MIYNLADDRDLEKFLERAGELSGREAVVELTRVSPKRTQSQNNYLHALLQGFGLEFGMTADEAKTVYKRDFNPHLYVYERLLYTDPETGEEIYSKHLRSTRDLTKDQMADSIDNLLRKSSELGCMLPAADDTAALYEINNKAEMYNRYLQPTVNKAL